MDEAERALLSQTLTAGMPGRMVEALNLDQFRSALDAYSHIDAAALRSNLRHFLQQVVPTAERAGVYMAIHPDDPPMPLLGLPRVVSTDADIEYVLASSSSPHNGLTFCVGSYASNATNRVEEMAEKSRSANPLCPPAQREAARRRWLLCRERPSRRRGRHVPSRAHLYARGGATPGDRLGGGGVLPFRPDHGHKMLDDLEAGKKTNPGYRPLAGCAASPSCEACRRPSCATRMAKPDYEMVMMLLMQSCEDLDERPHSACLSGSCHKKPPPRRTPRPSERHMWPRAHRSRWMHRVGDAPSAVLEQWPRRDVCTCEPRLDDRFFSNAHELSVGLRQKSQALEERPTGRKPERTHTDWTIDRLLPPGLGYSPTHPSGSNHG